MGGTRALYRLIAALAIVAVVVTSVPAPTPVRASEPATVPLVPVVGFWSTTPGISSAALASALAGSSTRYTRVLVAGSLPGATTATPEAIRAAVNTSKRTLGLLAIDDVAPDVHALALDGVDLFGNGRIRDLAAWPLVIAEPSGGHPPAYDPATTWTLVAGGDVMLDRTTYLRTVIQGKGANYPWNGGYARIVGRRCCSAAGFPLPIAKRDGGRGALRALFRDADLAVVNLEGPTVDAFRWHPRGLVFTFDPSLLTGLSRSGIDVVTIGNNHIGNAGRRGVKETIRHLREVGIAAVGAGRNATAAHAPAWFDVAGQRVALFGYDAVRPGYRATSTLAGTAGLVTADYRADITAARGAGADVVVVLPHWGVEYTPAPTSRQRVHARRLAKAGATVVLGSHSHVAGAMEFVRGRPVFYSMGNLIFDLTRSEATVEGLIVELTFSGARLTQIRLHPTVTVDLVQPNLLDPAGDGAVLIRRMQKASAALPPR